MGRNASYEPGQVFAAVGAEIAQTGNFTLQGLSKTTGLSIGSVYHRFKSREALLAETWLNAVKTFQAGFIAALNSDDRDAGLQAALETPRFCRRSPELAVVLACCRKEQFLGPDTPEAFAPDIAAVNDQLGKELGRFAKRVKRPLLSCQLAIVAYPLAAVQLFLPGQEVPDSIDGEVEKAYRAVMA
jgi:AcrR family transcriptional regulator